MVFDWLLGGPQKQLRSKVRNAEKAAKKAIKEISHGDIKGARDDIDEVADIHSDLKDRFSRQKPFLEVLDRRTTIELGGLLDVQEQKIDEAKKTAETIAEFMSEGHSATDLAGDIKELQEHMDQIKENDKRIEDLLTRLLNEKKKRDKEKEKGKKSEEEKPKKVKRCIDADRIEYTDKYTDLRDKRYASLKKNIIQTEENILTSPECTSNLHGPIKHGKYKGHLHARVTGNLRIIYDYKRKEKRVIFEDIMTKNDFDQL